VDLFGPALPVRTVRQSQASWGGDHFQGVYAAGKPHPSLQGGIYGVSREEVPDPARAPKSTGGEEPQRTGSRPSLAISE